VHYLDNLSVFINWLTRYWNLAAMPWQLNRFDVCLAAWTG